MRRLLAALCLCAASTQTQAEEFYPAQEGFGFNLCEIAVRVHAARFGIPENLLMAISLTETQRWSKHADGGVPWPWTVMAEGRGRYFRTKKEAVEAVERLQAAGVQNIDVGCMQINLYYHRGWYEDLDDAFTPGTNVNYAATFLSNLRKETDTWKQAAGKYHSRTPHHQQRYLGVIARNLRALNDNDSQAYMNLQEARNTLDEIRRRFD